jgi:sterol 3beta-glucosyltransferase
MMLILNANCADTMTVKGIEREINKHRLVSLQAEIYLTRLRQAVKDFNSTTAESRVQVVESWNTLQHQK